ncbi:MAG: proton-conducting transporter membrane subunit, partial [Candidatus Dormibacteraceae bacterium]
GVLWGLAAIAIYPLPRGRFRMTLIAAVAVLGSAACLAGGVLALVQPGSRTSLQLGTLYPLGTLRLEADPLGGFFLALTGLVSGLLFLGRPGTLANLRGKVPIAALALLLCSLEVIFVAGDVFSFLVGWELLAVSFYLLVTEGFRTNRDAHTAAYWTAGMNKIGGAAVLAAFLCLTVLGHSIDFSALRQHGAGLGVGLATATFLLALFGFGIKVALVPLQSWLPRAYPTSPTGTPAFMAALGLNAGFYGFLRVATSLLPVHAIWWGSLVVLLGAVTALLGILWAATQRNLKALLAYSSIEQSGIVMAAIGTSMVGRAAGVPLLAGLGLTVALLQIAVHALAKAGLFLCADAIQRRTGTVDLERLGGLGRAIPGLAVAFGVCAGSLIGLPPLGGFASEWLVLETLMQGFRTGRLLPEVAFALAGTLLALTAAIAGIAFVKAFWSAFLGFARDDRPSVRIGTSTVVAAAGLALLSAALGIAAPWAIPLIARAGPAVGVPLAGGRISTGDLLLQPAFAKFASIAPTELAIVVPAFAGLLLLLGLLVRSRRVPFLRRTPVWASGQVPGEKRTQYTPTAWTNPLRVVFDLVLRTDRTIHRQGPDLAPVSTSYRSHVPALVDERLVIPVVRGILRLAGWLQGLQSGSLARYVLYLLVVLVVALVVVAFDR